MIPLPILPNEYTGDEKWPDSQWVCGYQGKEEQLHLDGWFSYVQLKAIVEWMEGK